MKQNAFSIGVAKALRIVGIIGIGLGLTTVLCRFVCMPV